MRTARRRESDSRNRAPSLRMSDARPKRRRIASRDRVDPLSDERNAFEKPSRIGNPMRKSARCSSEDARIGSERSPSRIRAKSETSHPENGAREWLQSRFPPPIGIRMRQRRAKRLRTALNRSEAQIAEIGSSDGVEGVSSRVTEACERSVLRRESLMRLGECRARRSLDSDARRIHAKGKG